MTLQTKFDAFSSYLKSQKKLFYDDFWQENLEDASKHHTELKKQADEQWAVIEADIYANF